MLKPVKRWRWNRLDRALRVQGSSHGLPNPVLRVNAAPLLAVDLEMTGLDASHDDIVSIGWVPIERGAIDMAGAGEIGVRPGPVRSVGESATIHGIRDCDRTGGQTVHAALQVLLQALDGRVAVFHHAPLDTAFLDRAMRRELGFGWRTPWIDTLDWFRRRRLERDHETLAGSTRLEAVREHFGLDARSAHNALDDAIACAEIALVLAARSRARLLDACRLPRAMTRR
ncbi:MAG: 3'-5' exonuclease [Wenzhouxiangellaceae bacterium]